VSPDEERPTAPIARDEAEAVLAARAELGPTYDAALVESFAERVEQVVRARVAEQGGGLESLRKRELAVQKEAGGRQMVLGIVSLGTGIPITAIAGAFADLPGVLAAWAGIVGVNVAHALQGRRHD
jgi:hypothetical protein